jgi:nucleotide-binding universal stress UspA family protein
MPSFQKILVPLDFGEPSMRALAAAIDLAKLYGSSLTLFHTWEIPSYGYGAALPADVLTQLESSARAQLDAVLADVAKQVPDTNAILECGVPWRELLRTIELVDPDLVVMGTHGRKGIGRALLGSVTEKIVRMSPVPVLSMRTKSEP